MIKIILKKSINKIGKKYDVLSVKSGYALNYLIPQKYAILATESNIKINKEVLKQKKEKIINLIKKYKKYIKKIKKINIYIKKQENLSLKITKKYILKLLLDYNIIIKKEDINIKKNLIITNTGEYNIKISILNRLETFFKIIVK
ncbi:MAG: 50S ribosomal protein L9 [Candidatus Shikimatogenerans sp. JK-2022]|nr:50S ribosomal protein L9 [Candidatus Shikimatogenerans bostrichidophilus]